jgi:hypothetical protein
MHTETGNETPYLTLRCVLLQVISSLRSFKCCHWPIVVPSEYVYTEFKINCFSNTCLLHGATVIVELWLPHIVKFRDNEFLQSGGRQPHAQPPPWGTVFLIPYANQRRVCLCLDPFVCIQLQLNWLQCCLILSPIIVWNLLQIVSLLIIIIII